MPAVDNLDWRPVAGTTMVSAAAGRAGNPTGKKVRSSWAYTARRMPGEVGHLRQEDPWSEKEKRKKGNRKGVEAYSQTDGTQRPCAPQ